MNKMMVILLLLLGIYGETKKWLSWIIVDGIGRTHDHLNFIHLHIIFLFQNAFDTMDKQQIHWNVKWDSPSGNIHQNQCWW